MNYFKRESSQEVNKVYKTNDLSIFNQIEGNRPPNPQHIRRLSQSIKDNGLLCNPILVNEKFEVIDGQHRLLAAKEAKSEIYFVILKGYELQEVHALNLNQKNWTHRDFMNGYAEMGIESYVKLREFSKKNKDYSLNDCIALCSNITQSSTYSAGRQYAPSLATKKGKASKFKEVFEEGTWKGKDFVLAQEIADKIRLIKPYYIGYNRSNFVKTIISLLLYKKEFDFNEFMHKLRIQPTALVDCTSVSQYKMLIEDIYNYRRRNKINIRF
jgi:hypothetical protein